MLIEEIKLSDTQAFTYFKKYLAILTRLIAGFVCIAPDFQSEGDSELIVFMYY